jgi:hypothetical protein
MEKAHLADNTVESRFPGAPPSSATSFPVQVIHNSFDETHDTYIVRRAECKRTLMPCLAGLVTLVNHPLKNILPTKSQLCFIIY